MIAAAVNSRVKEILLAMKREDEDCIRGDSSRAFQSGVSKIELKFFNFAGGVMYVRALEDFLLGSDMNRDLINRITC
jgi:hypothetical protein